MIKFNKKKYIINSLVASSALVTAFIALSLLIAQKATVIGGEATDQLTWPILKNSPFIAIFAVSHMITYHFLLFFVLFINTFFAISRGSAVIISMSWTFLTLALAMFSQIILYPAPYEQSLPGWFSPLILKLGQAASPYELLVFACASGAIVFLLGQFATNPPSKSASKKKSRLPSNKVFWIPAIVLTSAACTILASRMTSAPSTEPLDLPSSQAAAGKTKKTFLLVVDSMRTDYVRPEIMPFLYELQQSPYSFAAQHHYVGVPRTFPSILEILSGLNSPANAVRHMFPSPETRQYVESHLRENLLPRVFQKNGYESIVISDFAGEIFPRMDLGFDKMLTPNMTVNSLIKSSIYVASPFFLPLQTLLNRRMFFPELDFLPVMADSDYLVEHAIRSLDQGKNQFVMVFFSNAHFPYASAHPNYLHPLEGKLGNEQQSSIYFQKNPSLKRSDPLNEAEKFKVKQLYAGALRGVDTSMRRLFRYALSHFPSEDITWIVTADHGEELFDYGQKIGHGEHLRGSISLNVPLVLFRSSGLPEEFIAQGADLRSQSIDIAPTALDLAGIATEPQRYDGKSLLTLKNSPSRKQFSESGIWFTNTEWGDFQELRLPYNNINQILKFDVGENREISIDPRYDDLLVTAKHRSLIRYPLKIIYMPTLLGIQWQLFDIAADPMELNNLADDHAYAEKFSEMRSVFFKELSGREKNFNIVQEFLVPKDETRY